MNGCASRDGRTQVNHQLFGRDSALLLGSDQRFKPRNPAWASCRRGEKTKLLHHPDYTISDVQSPYPPAHNFDIIENKQLPIAQLRNNHLFFCAMSDCRSSRWILSAGMPQKIGGADGLKPVIKPLVSSKKTANRFDPLSFLLILSEGKASVFPSLVRITSGPALPGPPAGCPGR